MSDDKHDGKNGFGISAAKDEGTGKTKYDKPSTGADDMATDERRDKPIRGPEDHNKE